MRAALYRILTIGRNTLLEAVRQKVLNVLLIFAVVLGSQPSGRETVGRQADGTVLLPNGWKIAPVGDQVLVAQEIEPPVPP